MVTLKLIDEEAQWLLEKMNAFLSNAHWSPRAQPEEHALYAQRIHDQIKSTFRDREW